MKFLDQVISESLRLWPPVGLTNRECNKDFSVNLNSGKTLTIKNGENVIIPVMAIHRDSKFYTSPNTYDPHRFDDDKKDSILPGSFIPFGYGPRVCIGSRFALMEAKLIIFNILSKFTIETCDQTPKELKLAGTFGQFELKEKIFVELKPRK
jgi:cytochrome P450 family 9